MKKIFNRGADTLPIVLSVLASVIIAACIYASIFVISRRMDASLLIESTEGLKEKMNLVELLSAIGLLALVVMIVGIQIVNNNSYIKPLHILRVKAERFAKAGKDAMKDVDALYNELNTISDIARQMQSQSVDNAVSINDMNTGFTRIATAARQMFVNSATIDNDVAQLIKDLEAHQDFSRTEIVNVLKNVGNVENVGAIGDVGGMGNAHHPGAGAPPLLGGEWGGRSDGGVLTDVYEKLITEASGFIDLLGRVREYLSGKLGSCAAIIKETAARANQITLDAAIASARAGSPGREFAFIAEDIRVHAESLYEVLKDINEAIEQTESQTALISELATLHKSAENKAHQPEVIVPEVEAAIYASAKPEAGAFNAAETANAAAALSFVENYDWAGWDKGNSNMRGGLDALRVSLRSVGATLAESSDAASSEIKRLGQIVEENSTALANLKNLITLLGNANRRIEGITNNIRIIESYREK